MKKILIVLTTLLTLVSVALQSQNLSTAIQNSLGERLFTSFSCKLYVKATSENSLLLLCNTNESSNLYFDKAFVIYSSDATSKLEFSESDIFEIQIPENRKYAVIYNKTTNKICFMGLSNMVSKISSIKKSSGIVNAVNNIDYFGYGISFLTNKWDASVVKSTSYSNAFSILDVSEFQRPISKPLPSSADGGPVCGAGNCTSGGVGSSSCSIDGSLNSCSVSCNTGYYACCDDNQVRCFCCPEAKKTLE